MNKEISHFLALTYTIKLSTDSKIHKSIIIFTTHRIVHWGRLLAAVETQIPVANFPGILSTFI